MSEHHMATEIDEQPPLLRQNAPAWQASAEAARAASQGYRDLALVGRGSSGNACTFASYLLGLKTGRHPIEFRPWLASQEEVPDCDWSDTVVHAYSVSGQSTDVTNAAAWLRHRGARVIGVTNAEDDCALGRISDELVRLQVGAEKAVPATKTFTAQLFIAAALAGYPIAAAAEEVADAMGHVEAEDIERLVEFIDGARTLSIIARGPALGAALDAALKLQESAAMPCTAYSAAEFLHGPIGAISAADRVLLFADKGGGAESLEAVRTALIGRRTPFLTLDDGDTTTLGPSSIPLPLPEERWCRAPMFVYVAQRGALALAGRRGLDPDAPLGLNKVTLTV